MKLLGPTVSFVQQTPLHGFGFLSSSHKWCEYGFWVIMILAATVMAVYQTVNLVLVYLTDPTYSSVIPMVNKTFSLARTTLCVQYGWPQVAEYVYKESEISKLLQTFSDEDILLLQTPVNSDKAPTLNKDLVIQFLMLYGSVSAAEWAFIDNDYDTMSNASNWATDVANMTTIISFFTQRNVSMSKLWQTVVYSACQLMNTTAIVSVRNTDWRTRKTEKVILITLNICVTDKVTFLDYNLFCLKVNSRQATKSLFKFSFATDFVEFRMQPELLFSQPNYNLSTTTMIVDLDGRDFVYSMSDAIVTNPGNTVVASMGESKCFQLSIDGDYQLYNSKRKPCSNDPSQLDCITGCSAQAMQNACGCWPTIFNRRKQDISSLDCTEMFETTDGQRNLSECLSNYASLRNSNTNIEQDDSRKLNDCTNKCQSNCRHLKYFIQAIEDRECNNHANVTSIHLEVGDFAYIFAIEEPTTSWQNFLSDLGGIIGVWLGGSIIAFVHIPVQLCKVIGSVLARSKVKQLKTETV